MQQSIHRLITGLFFIVLGTALFAQVYEVSYEMKERKKEKKVTIYMKSAADSATRIRAVNFSIAYDSTCSTLSSYDCIFSEKWTTFIERSGSRPTKDSLNYEGNNYNSRWIFGTGQMPNTQNVILPPNSEKPVKILTVTFSKVCKTAPLYLEDEKEFRVNQMGDENNKAVPWVLQQETRK